MSIHRLLCKLGIHEWSRSSRNIMATGGAKWIRACWVCGVNETTHEEPDFGCDSPGGVLLGWCKCAECTQSRNPKFNSQEKP